MKPYNFVFTFPVQVNSVGSEINNSHQLDVDISLYSDNLQEACRKFRQKMQSAVGEMAEVNQPDWFDELTKND